MKINYFNKSAILILLFFLINCSGEKDASSLKGDYLGKKPPGDIPEVFAPGTISHGFHEHCLTISPDDNEMCWGTASSDYNFYALIYIKRENNIWQEPEILPFSIEYKAMSPRFSLDGEKLYFSSRQFASNRKNQKENFDIFYIQKLGENWSEPVNLGSPVNTDKNEFAPSFSQDGSIYFQHWETSGNESDIYCSKMLNGKYQKPKKLEGKINAEDYDAGPFIAPDESYLLFQSVRPENIGDHNTNICISFCNEDKTWSSPFNLGEKVNGSGNPIHAMISPDGKYLFFSTNSNREPFKFKENSYSGLIKSLKSHLNGHGTHYWMDAKIIEDLKTNLNY